jgi:hypothetical protein
MRSRTGELANNYKGGETNTGNAGKYKGILSPNHPFKDKRGYVLKHRLIYEHYLKILFDEDVYIPPTHDIHHIIPVDEGGTDTLINLTCLSKAEHRRRHIKDMTGIICSICGSDKTLMIKYADDFIRPKWFGNKEKGFICSKCHDKDPIVKERATQKRHERMKDPVYRQKKREYQREHYKKKKLLKQLEINTLDKYSN